METRSGRTYRREEKEPIENEKEKIEHGEAKPHSKAAGRRQRRLAAAEARGRASVEGEENSEEKSTKIDKPRPKKMYVPLAVLLKKEEEQKKVVQEAADNTVTIPTVDAKTPALATGEAPIEPKKEDGLPSFLKLIEECNKAKNKDTEKHGCEQITELHQKRRQKLLLTDAIIFHLKNDSFPLKATAADEKENEKRDVLAGAMIFVKKEIKGEYWFFSPDNSTVHLNYNEALKAFDDQASKRALVAFARYFCENKLNANESKPLERYKPDIIMKAIPDYHPPKKADDDEQNKEKRGFSLFGFLRPASVVTVPEEKQEKLVVRPT